MKRVAIHQPNYFPWMGYFAKVARADAFVFLDDVAYQSGNATSVTNRAKVKTAAGPHLLSVPVARAASGLICDMGIDNTQAWARKHLDTIRFAYARSPYFAEVYAIVQGVVGTVRDRLAVLNRQSVSAVCEYLDIRTPMVDSSRLSIASREKNLRIVEICGRLEATHYLSGSGARSYNDEGLFASRGLTIEYTAFQCPQYPQLHGDFVPNLSILDALFNCGRDARRLLT